MAVDASGLFWWHSIRLPDGSLTPGERSAEVLEHAWTSLQLPPLAGKNVLDVGAWDGWFSFRAEAEGAARVVAIDSHVWERDFARKTAHGPPLDRATLPGKRSFDLARAALSSRVESVLADIVEDELDWLGGFDLVLFLGVLYHLREPLRALERLRTLTRELAVVETAAIRVEGHEDASLIEFLEADELNSDPTNWHVPTEPALLGMCRAAGFRSAETVARTEPLRTRGTVDDYRLTAHARP